MHLNYNYCFSGLTSPLVVDKIGRRPLLIYTYSAASMILGVIGSYFFVQQVIGINNESTSIFRYTVFLGTILSNIIANFGFDTLVFIIPSEIFPLNVRATAMTVTNIYTGLVTFIALRCYQIMEDHIGLYGVFWVYAITAASGAVFTYFVVTETRGKTLRDIQIDLQGNIYDESEEKLNVVTNINNVNDVENNTELKNMTEKVDR